MNDTGTLILIGIIVVAVVLLIQRLMRQQQQAPYSQPGHEYPHNDDPNITSSGGFGGSNQNQGTFQRQHDDPNIESHGGFGRNGDSVNRPSVSRSRNVPTPISQSRTAVSEKSAELNRGNDDPNVSSHGGFGGKR